MTPESHEGSLRTYLAVFVALLVLTAATVVVAFVDLGGLNGVVALSIAGGKAALVALWFMHVWHGSKLVKSTIIAGCCWVAILIAITMSDFLTRSW